MWLRLVPPPRAWNFRKLMNGLDPTIKATTLILAIELSKFKSHVVRKRERDIQ